MSNTVAKGRLVELPINTRRALIAMFFIGLILIVAASLLKGSSAHIRKDKIIHFTAYNLLAIALTLGFRFRYTVVGLFLLALSSYAVELIQPWNHRSKDFFDAWANTAGICIGAGVGFALRIAVNFFWSEWQEIRLNRYLKSFKEGDTIVASGQKKDCFYVVKSGTVDVFHIEDGRSVPIASLAEGAVFGLISEALDKRQEETILAATDCVVYELNYDNIIEESGGEKQPISIIMNALIKQYDMQIDSLVEELIESPSSDPVKPEAGFKQGPSGILLVDKNSDGHATNSDDALLEPRSAQGQDKRGPSASG